MKHSFPLSHFAGEENPRSPRQSLMLETLWLRWGSHFLAAGESEEAAVTMAGGYAAKREGMVWDCWGGHKEVLY